MCSYHKVSFSYGMQCGLKEIKKNVNYQVLQNEFWFTGRWFLSLLFRIETSAETARTKDYLEFRTFFFLFQVLFQEEKEKKTTTS